MSEKNANDTQTRLMPSNELGLDQYKCFFHVMGVDIFFKTDPNLLQIAAIRLLLDGLTDEIIQEKLNGLFPA
jgi:hypothetical protein